MRLYRHCTRTGVRAGRANVGSPTPNLSTESGSGTANPSPDEHRHHLPRGEERSRTAIRGSTSRRRRRRGDRRRYGAGRRRRAAAPRPGALQRSIADRAADADARRRSRPTRRCWRRRLEPAIAFRESLHRRDRVPPGARRSRSAAVADRRSLRRLPGRPGAVAGHRSAAAGRSPRLLVELLQPARHPRAQRSARPRCSKGSSSASRCCTARCPRRSTSAKARIVYHVDLHRGQKTGLFLDQRENRVAAARYARGRLLDASATTAASRCAGAALQRGARDRHLGGRGRADRGRTPRATAWRTSRRGR